MTIDLRTAMRQAGLDYVGPLDPDGKLHRIKVEGDNARNSWYVFYSGPPQAAAFGCWRRSISQTWCARNGEEFSQKQWAQIRRNWKEAESERKRVEIKTQADAAKAAKWVISQSKQADNAHSYLIRKHVTAWGELREYREALVLPLRDDGGRLHSLQFIHADGAKRFLSRGRTVGCYFTLAENSGPLVICEGYATGASIHEATGWAVICAMHCGNLLPVARALRSKWPDREIIIAADNDQFTTGNPGLTKATEAAESIKAFLAVPAFADEALADKPTDFNDLARMSGSAIVRQQVHRANPITRALLDREFNHQIQPPPLKPVYSLAGQCICTAGNLTTITAAIKTGKSAVVGAMVGAANPHSDDADLLSFDSENPEGLALLWFDSEQSISDFWWCVSVAIRRAGLDKPPAWLHAYCLTGLGHKRAWECVIKAIELVQDQGIHSIMLDGAADFIGDVNDAEESNAFVATLHGKAIECACPIVNVIHFNPGSEKSRGHLGSQLERKAETNLTLEKDADETTVIYSTKNRRAGIPKSIGPRFAFSKDAGMHVSVASRQSCKEAAERDTLMSIALDAFNGRPAIRYSELQSTVKKALTVSDRTAERKLAEMKRLTVIKQSVAGLYVINQQPTS